MDIGGAGTADGAVPTIPPTAPVADVPWNVGSHEIALAEGTTPITAPANETENESNDTSHFPTLSNYRTECMWWGEGG